jgi:hypothetical protein
LNVKGEIDDVVSPYDRYIPPPLTSDVQSENDVLTELVPDTVNDVCDPGTMTETHPPFITAWVFMNALSVSENGSRLGEAEDDEMLIDPPLPPA